ncbi:hypothetical protein FS837_001857 [Tulasnella sp. UAMH 9824]|nr:hypothetical protein FS837_001857 [Tulasnella sp. UAMH 9824]
MRAICCKPDPIDFDGEVNLFPFVLLQSVGKGPFGKVRVVQHKQTKNLYALKCINKVKCVKMKAVANIIPERRLLDEDDENCFFVLDLMLGGDLRFHLERLGSLSEDAVRFYTAQIGSALAFLHDKRIIHRDLKPDNVLLDEKGNAHIADLNIAVHYSERRMLTGVAGSMAYTGSHYTIDWWPLGVCAYELVFGRRPFRGKTNTDFTYLISRDPVQFPEGAEQKCSREGMTALAGMRERDVTKRLGCRPKNDGFEELKKHPWFALIDWDTLKAKTQASPLFPTYSKKAKFDRPLDKGDALVAEALWYDSSRRAG